MLTIRTKSNLTLLQKSSLEFEMTVNNNDNQNIIAKIYCDFMHLIFFIHIFQKKKLYDIFFVLFSNII